MDERNDLQPGIITFVFTCIFPTTNKRVCAALHPTDSVCGILRGFFNQPVRRITKPIRSFSLHPKEQFVDVFSLPSSTTTRFRHSWEQKAELRSRWYVRVRSRPTVPQKFIWYWPCCITNDALYLSQKVRAAPLCFPTACRNAASITRGAIWTPAR